MIRALSLAATAFVAALALSSLGAAQEQPPPRIVAIPEFGERPSQLDFQDLYPQRAVEACRNGQVDLACVVRANGRVDCEVARERPRGWGFGEASLRAVRRFRVAPYNVEGYPIRTFETHFYWETSRRFSDRPWGCTERNDAGAFRECVVRTPCQREPEPPPFG